MARGLTMFGADEDDIIQNTHGYGLFTGGFGVHYGAQKIGATVIPISTGQTKRQIEIMNDFSKFHGFYLQVVDKDHEPWNIPLTTIQYSVVKEPCALYICGVGLPNFRLHHNTERFRCQAPPHEGVLCSHGAREGLFR